MWNRDNLQISILIPCYNTAPYLRQCMESVINQTYSNLQIICINDGSTDNTLDILKEYAEKDLRIVIVDQPNGGYGKAMNAGSAVATGDYIGIVEPDDYIALDMYETLVKAAEENELDFVKSDFNRFAKNEQTGEIEYFYNQLCKDKSKYNKVFKPLNDLESFRYIMNTWTGIYRRSFLEKYNIRYNETPGASFQDNGFWFLTFAYAQKAMILNKPFYFNRRDNPNSSVKNTQKVYAINVEYDYIRKNLESAPEIWNAVKGYYWLKKLDNYHATLKRIADELKPDFVKRIALEFKRAEQTLELDWSLFTPYQTEKVKVLINESNKFYVKFYTAKNESVNKQNKPSKAKVVYYKNGNPVTRKLKNLKLMYKEDGVKLCVKHIFRKRYHHGK